jgi:hypothetical protein
MHSGTQHEISSGDREFRSDFEAFRVTPPQFNHAAHVRLAYIYLVEGDADSAVRKMREALRAFLQHHGIPPGKYHETLTHAWVLAVRHFMTRSGNALTCASAADFIARNPELQDTGIMLTHYSASVLFSAEARESFVEPDLDPIPQSGNE